jgi:hypothetical protein
MSIIFQTALPSRKKNADGNDTIAPYLPIRHGRRRGMHRKNLQSRITRLQELIMRLSQEDASSKDDIYPLHLMERNAYLSAIHKAIGALSEARIALSQATHRLGDPK